MKESCLNPLSNTIESKPDTGEMLNAVTALCGADRAVAAQLQKGLSHLLSSGEWSKDITRLGRCGFSARYLAGQLRDALDMPGDLVLFRDAAGNVTLLYRSDQRWRYLAEDGAALAEEVTVDGRDEIEAVVMTVPKVTSRRGGVASLAALWPELRSAWAEVGAGSLFINVGQLLLPLFSMLVYDKIAQNGLYETLWALTLGMGLYLATDAGMRLIRSWATERIGANLTLRGDETLWSKLVSQIELPAGGFPRFISNYRDLTLSRDFVSSSYVLSVADLPFLILYLGVIGIIAWPLMILTIVLVMMYAVTGLLLQMRQNNLSRESERHNTTKLSFMGETLASLDVVRTSPGSGAFLRTWRELAEQSATLEKNRRVVVHHIGTASAVMLTVTTVAVLIAGVYLIQAQMLTIGKLIACNLLANRAMALVASLFAVMGKWEDFNRAAARMEASLEPVKERDCTPRPSIAGSITVIGLSKKYPERPAALETVTFSVAQGERIALLGRPGAGKSILLRCLGGLSRPDGGQILIDGLALEDIARSDRVQWLAYKAQDPAVFAGTLEENLRISGCTDPARFSAAIWASGLENEFKSGQMSLGMRLDERGNNLSGGQRQKVALARALAQSSRILLLDEPTLGLDPESERMLAERLPKVLDPCGVLVMTTHSAVMLGTVQRVIALDGGRIVADGPREKLVTIS